MTTSSSTKARASTPQLRSSQGTPWWEAVLSLASCSPAAHADPKLIQDIPYPPQAHNIQGLGITPYVITYKRIPYDASTMRAGHRLLCLPLVFVPRKGRPRFPTPQHTTSSEQGQVRSTHVCQASAATRTAPLSKQAINGPATQRHKGEG